MFYRNKLTVKDNIFYNFFGIIKILTGKGSLNSHEKSIPRAFLYFV
jgi:hypothetical protein